MTTYQHIRANKRKTVVLVTGFVLFIMAVGWVFAEVLGYGPDALLVAGFVAVVMSLFGYFSSDTVALMTAGAHPIQKEDNPYVYRLVENLCITAGLPMPKIYIIDDAQTFNAFATGRKPEKASIALTTGLIHGLENEELEGVIAHELSHIKNYDIRVMTIVIVLVGIVSLLAHFFLRASFFGGGRSNDNRNQVGFVLVIVGIALSVLSPLIAKLIQLAVSRKREFLADASGVLLTRYPEGLARALEKIQAHNTQPSRRANPATAHLYISNPFGEKTRSFTAKWFSTHPPVQERIQALRGMA